LYENSFRKRKKSAAEYTYNNRERECIIDKRIRARRERVPPEHIEMGGDDELAKHTKVRLGGQRVLLGREREFLSLSIFFSSPSLDRFFFCLSFLEENTRTD
jgi:hypothetical protein